MMSKKGRNEAKKQGAFSKYPVTIVEVGIRDGLQYEADFFPTEKKVELIERLAAAGLRKIEVTSFVHPKMVPQLKDAEELLKRLRKLEGVVYSALVPNQRGCERALRTQIDEIAIFVSASEIHNRKNVNMSIEESLKELEAVSKMAAQDGRSVRGYVVTAFGCPYEGRIPYERLLRIIEAYRQMGVSEISLGDTTGMANPIQVKEMVRSLAGSTEGVGLAMHFHNSRGTGLANAYAAYEAGCRVFDSSIGGLGGCPTAVGAMGNVTTEDLVNMMEEMGASTGIDFDRLLEASKFAEETLGTTLPSFTLRVGRPDWKGTAPS